MARDAAWYFFRKMHLNTGQICDLLTWMLGGSCEAVSLSQSIILLEKVSCPVPRHLTKSVYEYVLVVLPIHCSWFRKVLQLLSTKKCRFFACSWSHVEAIAIIQIGIYLVVKDTPCFWKWLSSYVLNSHSWAYNIAPSDNVQYYLLKFLCLNCCPSSL